MPLSTTTGGVADGSAFSVKRSMTTAIKFFSASAATALTGRQSRNNFRRLARTGEGDENAEEITSGNISLVEVQLESY